MENIFNALCSVLAEPELKHAFLEAEGVELMALIMKEKVVARTRAIKVMAYATQGEDGKGCCERFVEVLGLKSLFSAFMGKVSELIRGSTSRGISSFGADPFVICCRAARRNPRRQQHSPPRH
jgi:beta-catenin-like protein 1